MSVHPANRSGVANISASKKVFFKVGRVLKIYSLLCLVGFLAVVPIFAQESGIEALGFIPEGNFTDVYGISADGSVVVGTTGYYEGSGWNVTYEEDHAYRWTSSGGIELLGTLGGDYSWANAVSGNGLVIVGDSEITSGSSTYHAFRWTSSGMQDLGTLPGGFDSEAHGVSYDGSVVVGAAWNSSEYVRAFRWTQSTGMTDLGTLGGNRSDADAISNDGLVIVGDAETTNGSEDFAFRWTQSTGMVSLGALSGGTVSTALGVDADGSVIVGWSTGTGFSKHAYRWTQSVGMVDLGTLSGDYVSAANAVSGDGTVVVGESFSTTNQDYFSRRGFRWTQETGMQTVEDWLTDNGVTIPSGLSPVSSVRAVSYDGSVVAGDLVDENGFVARVTGMLVMDERLAASLASPASVTQSNLALGDLILNGAHSRPLSYRVDKGKNAVWAAGDWGQDTHDFRDGDLGLAEVGAGHNFGPAQFNAAFGYTWENQDLTQRGKLDADGFYLLGETLVPLGGRVSAVMGGFYHWGDADIRRGYFNAETLDYSSGSTDTNNWAMRGRLEWEAVTNPEGDLLSPYGELSYTSSRMNAYTETGGGFPAEYGERKDKALDLRYGFNAAKAVGNGVKLIGLIEGIHRFDDAATSVGGQIIDLFEFDLDGRQYEKDWMRGGGGIAFEIAGGTMTFMVNGTTLGEDPSTWITARYQAAF